MPDVELGGVVKRFNPNLLKELQKRLEDCTGFFHLDSVSKNTTDCMGKQQTVLEEQLREKAKNLAP